MEIKRTDEELVEAYKKQNVLPEEVYLEAINNTNIMADSIEPFKYEDLKEFNMSYLSGFLSEKYDVDKDDAYKRAYERIEKSTIEELKSTIRKRTIDLLRTMIISTKHILNRQKNRIQDTVFLFSTNNYNFRRLFYNNI